MSRYSKEKQKNKDDIKGWSHTVHITAITFQEVIIEPNLFILEETVDRKLVGLQRKTFHHKLQCKIFQAKQIWSVLHRFEHVYWVQGFFSFFHHLTISQFPAKLIPPLRLLWWTWADLQLYLKWSLSSHAFLLMIWLFRYYCHAAMLNLYFSTLR